MKEKLNLPSLTPVEFVSVLHDELFRLLAYEEWEMDQQIEEDKLLYEGVSNFFKRLYSAPTIIPLGDNHIMHIHNPYGIFSFDSQKITIRPLRSMAKPKEVTTLSGRKRIAREAREKGLTTDKIKKMSFYEDTPTIPHHEVRLPFIVFDEIMRIFFRLTQRPTNSLIPLRDLIDDPSDNTRYSFYRSLLAHLAQKIEFPFPYYPSSAVFKRQEDTLQQVVAIENVKAVLSGTCPHCNGNFQHQQVEAYTNGETITCEYCQYSLKAEWRSMR